MRKLLVLSCLTLAPLSASAQLAAKPVDAYDAAVAAARKLKDAAPATLETLRAMPVEFAGITKVAGYAGEVPNTIHEPDLAATLAAKRAYWAGHARALGRRLADLGGDELRHEFHIQPRGETRALAEAFRRSRRSMLAQAEKDAVIAALGRVESVLADIAADEKGEDSGQALIDRKLALFEKLKRS